MPPKQSKKRIPRASAPTRRPGTRAKPVKERRLVVLDQGPLRKKASSECQKAMSRLEKLRVDWRRFDREDKPAFTRWMSATFGPLLSRTREVEELIREKEILIQEVKMEVGYGSNWEAAYKRVQYRRSHPPLPEEDPGYDSSPPGGQDDVSDSEWDEIEDEFLFQDFLAVLGLNPDRMSDKQYERMFREFKENILNEPPPEPATLLPPAATPATGPGRIKEIYRVLVRRLHPDMRADGDAEVSTLWHEVQEAYAAGNLDRLEMLLAFTDIQADGAGDHTTLFQMRAVLDELRGAMNALQRNLRAAKKDPAWNFVRLEDRRSLEEQQRNELATNLERLEEEFNELTGIIAMWSAKQTNPRKKPQKSQMDFQF
jgi:hypothetical protein